MVPCNSSRLRMRMDLFRMRWTRYKGTESARQELRNENVVHLLIYLYSNARMMIYLVFVIYTYLYIYFRKTTEAVRSKNYSRNRLCRAWCDSSIARPARRAGFQSCLTNCYMFESSGSATPPGGGMPYRRLLWARYAL